MLIKLLEWSRMSVTTIFTNSIIQNIGGGIRVNQEFDHPDNSFTGEGESNQLWQYVQSLSPEIISQLSQPDSQEVFQVMERNIINLLGNLPSGNFDISIGTTKEHLGKLLASAMMSGYFLRNVEQRMHYEKSFHLNDY